MNTRSVGLISQSRKLWLLYVLSLVCLACSPVSFAKTISPVGNITDSRATFTWERAAGASVSTHIQIERKSDGATVLSTWLGPVAAKCSGQRVCKWQSTVSTNGAHRWRVQFKDGAGPVSAWSNWKPYNNVGRSPAVPSPQTVDRYIRNVFAYGLGRTVLTGGLDNHKSFINHSGSRSSCVSTLEDWSKKTLTGPEANNRYWTRSTNEVVNRLYQSLLGRQSDSSGLSYWASAIGNAKVNDTAAVIAGLLASDEYKNVANAICDSRGGLNGDHFLSSGERLFEGVRIHSPGKKTYITVGNGKLRFANANRIIWESDTAGIKSVTMSAQGNLVGLKADGSLLGGITQTHGNSGARLAVQDDENLVVYHSNAAIWDSKTISRLRNSENLADQVAVMVAKAEANRKDAHNPHAREAIQSRATASNSHWHYKQIVDDNIPNIRSYLGEAGKLEKAAIANRIAIGNIYGNSHGFTVQAKNYEDRIHTNGYKVVVTKLTGAEKARDIAFTAFQSKLATENAARKPKPPSSLIYHAANLCPGVTIAWNAVSKGVDGNPIGVKHYLIYVDGNPVSHTNSVNYRIASNKLTTGQSHRITVSAVSESGVESEKTLQLYPHNCGTPSTSNSNTNLSGNGALPVASTSTPAPTSQSTNWTYDWIQNRTSRSGETQREWADRINKIVFDRCEVHDDAETYRCWYSYVSEAISYDCEEAHGSNAPDSVFNQCYDDGFEIPLFKDILHGSAAGYISHGSIAQGFQHAHPPSWHEWFLSVFPDKIAATLPTLPSCEMPSNISDLEEFVRHMTGNTFNNLVNTVKERMKLIFHKDFSSISLGSCAFAELGAGVGGSVATCSLADTSGFASTVNYNAGAYFGVAASLGAGWTDANKPMRELAGWSICGGIDISGGVGGSAGVCTGLEISENQNGLCVVEFTGAVQSFLLATTGVSVNGSYTIGYTNVYPITWQEFLTAAEAYIPQEYKDFIKESYNRVRDIVGKVTLDEAVSLGTNVGTVIGSIRGRFGLW